MHRNVQLLCLIVLAVVASDLSIAAQSFSLRASLYYTAVQRDYAPGEDAVFLNMEGEGIAVGSQAFLKAAEIEGSAELSDGTVLNIDGFVRGEVRWKRVSPRFGIDSRGCPLVPFRSAAVDPTVIPLGTRLFVRETKGIRLPGGRTHDGIWYATDIGPLIKGRRIDLFVGRGMRSIAVIESAGIDYLDPVHAEILDLNLPCL